MVIHELFLPARYRSGRMHEQHRRGFSQYGGDCSGQSSFTVVNVPIVPTLTCGFVRSNFSLDTVYSLL